MHGNISLERFFYSGDRSVVVPCFFDNVPFMVDSGTTCEKFEDETGGHEAQCGKEEKNTDKKWWAVGHVLPVEQFVPKCP